MPITAEELSRHIADLIFSNNWKETRQRFFNIPNFKGDDRKLVDELLLFLFFCGDISILLCDYKDESILIRTRNKYKQLWVKFAKKISLTVLDKLDSHFITYNNVLENYDDVSGKTLAWFIGKEFCVNCDIQTIDVAMYVSSVFNLLNTTTVKFIRDILSNGVV
jgi:hypothetical protein